MAEIINLNDDKEKTERALSAMDKLSEQWAEEVDLPKIVTAINGDAGKVYAMLRQAFEEGAFRGLEAREFLDEQQSP